MTIFYLMYFLLDGMCIFLTFAFWRRTEHPGFGWFTAAFVSQIVFQLLTLYASSLGTMYSAFGGLIYVLYFMPKGVFSVLAVAGLLSFQSTLAPRRRGAPADIALPAFDWTTIKRRGIGIIGVGLILAGIYTVLQGINYIQQHNGTASDLGAGPGAILIGAMCVGLSLHPKSPFQPREKKDDNAGENPL